MSETPIETPKSGMQVAFFPGEKRAPLAAWIAFVHPPQQDGEIERGRGPAIVAAPSQKFTLVNLMVLAEDGQTFNRLRVPFVDNKTFLPLPHCKAVLA